MFKHFKWLSAKNIVDNLKELFSRFPLVAIDTFVATVCGYILIESTDWVLNDTTEHIVAKILLMAVLGFPLLTAATLISEKFKLKKQDHALLQVVGLVLLTIYYFVLPENPDRFGMIESSRLIVFNLIAYLLALSVPFYERGESLKFWRFVEVAFARLVVAAFFSLTLWGGIALSLAAVDYLFGANIEGDTYAKAFIMIAGIFGAWFFLAGFPKVHGSLSEKMEESRVLKVFLQDICVPLLCIFFVILYAYLGKIVVLWDWPLGGVANWILGFSSAGFLVYVLSYPLLEKSEHSFFKNFFRVFFALVIPMVAVLALAIYFRVSEYGVTEVRYLVMLGGVWLLASAVYFLLSKHKELKLLPYLAAIFLFFAAWGPWSMYSVSLQSQTHHLENLLNQYHLLENGRAVAIKNEESIPLKDRASMYSKIQYLTSHNEFEQLHEWFPTVSTTDAFGMRSYGFGPDTMNVLGITQYYDYAPVQENQDYRYLTIGGMGPLNVQGFDILIRNVGLYPDQGQPIVPNYTIASTTYSFQLDKNIVRVIENGQEVFSSDLTPYVKDWMEKYSEDIALRQQKVAFEEGTGDEMKIDFENNTERMRLSFNNMSLHKSGETWNVEGADAVVLIDRK